MQNIVSATINLDEAVALINHIFRDCGNLPPTMQQEFPLLFCEENKQNMRALYKEGRIASIASYLPTDIIIEGTVIPVCSIGGVCTHEDFERQGLSSIVLDDAEKNMIAQEIDIMIVSGQRNLYLRRGCSIIQCIEEYTFIPENADINFTIREYTNEDIHSVSKIYNQNPTRYKRSLDEFSTFMDAVLLNKWRNYDRKRYVIEENDKIVGYFIIFNTESNKAFVQEASGRTDILVKAFKKLAHQQGFDSVSLHVHKNDTANQYSDFAEKKEMDQSGTLKILRYSPFMEHLNPYFSQYLTDSELSKLNFYESENKFVISFGEESVNMNDIDTVNHMVFGGIIPETELELGKVLRKIFPIPFPYTANLNFQ